MDGAKSGYSPGTTDSIKLFSNCKTFQLVSYDFAVRRESLATKKRQQARRPSVRSVTGSNHQFTVITYDESEEDDNSSILLPAITAPTPHTASSRKYSVPEVKVEDPPRNYNHRESILQRSLSLHDDPILRKAVQNNFEQKKHTSFANGDLLEDHVDHAEHAEEAYKTGDWRKEFIDVARWGRIFGKRKRNRLVHKSGEYNTHHVNVPKRTTSYMLDIFTTLLEIRWIYTLLLLVLSFVCSWVVFALIWWGIAAVEARRNEGSENEVICVIGVSDFVTALLFSIETQHTIGYGTRAMTDECPGAILLMMIQSVFGVVSQCIVTGLVFAKLGRAKKRGETLMFSKNAVISRYRGNLCLMFQIADMRKAHMICVTVSAMMLKHKLKQVTRQDLSQSMCHYKLELHTEVDDFIFLAMPVRVIHRIDEHSPLYEMGPEQLLSENFEIVVVLEGVNETTGMSTQVRTSYLPGEIMWGHKHGPLITNQRKNGIYNIDYTRFNDVVPVDTPELSARDMMEQGKLSSRRASTFSRRASDKSTAIPHHYFAPQISTVDEKDEETEHSGFLPV